MTISTPAAMRSAADRLHTEWQTDPRWAGVARDYSAEEVIRLRGSIQEEHTLARHGAERLWRLLHEEDYVPTLGALTGGQAVQQVRAGLKAIYVSGWQVAADANTAGHTYPDQSIYPVNSVPQLVRRINNALRRADQIAWAEATESAMSTQVPEKANAPAASMATQVPEKANAAKAADAGMAAEAAPAETGTGPARAPYWLAPIVADAEAGFGGVLNVFELMTAMIAAGAAGVHWEDQLASEKKCGHLGGKVLVPTGAQIRTLSAARLAADVAGVPTLVIARTDAESASLLTSDVDERDRPFLSGERTSEGYHRVRNGLDACIARALAYAPYADLLWMETPTPDLAVATAFAEAVRAPYPDQLLAYNCSPSFHWRAHLDDGAIAKFQRELGQLGYAFQFITLAGFHSLQHGMFTLAREYAESGMSAYVALQQAELAAEPFGYTATRHQREVGTGYFDLVTAAVTPASSTLALAGSTEQAQF